MDPNSRKEEPPVLRIKKDAVVAREFRYKREERLSHASAPQEPKRMGGILRGLFGRGRKRGVLSPIILAAMVLLAGVLYLRLSGRPSEAADVAGFHLVLRGIQDGEVLAASVTFQPVKAAEAELPAVITFKLSKTGQSVMVSETVTSEGSVVWGDLHYAGGTAQELMAEVAFAGKTARLSVKLDRARNP